MGKNALIVNFTGFNGHFGMLGTSVAIVEQLLVKGYDLSVIGIDEFRDEGFSVEALKSIRCRAERADIVFVNGEGTLHGWRPSSIALLMLIEKLLDFGRAPVYLANFSCFPGSRDINPSEHDAKYRKVLHAVSQRGQVIVRDELSARVLQRLGVSHQLGFDSFPLFAARYFGELQHAPGNRVVVSGGAGMRPESLRRLAILLETGFGSDYDLVYISGGTDVFVEADRKQYELMRTIVPRLEFVRPKSATEFLRNIAIDVCTMVTGRFHYAIAARSLGTPCVAWSSNTVKTEAVGGQLGLLGVLSDVEFDYESARAILTSGRVAKCGMGLDHIRKLSEVNYSSIPVASREPRFHPGTLHLYGRLLGAAGIDRSSDGVATRLS